MSTSSERGTKLFTPGLYTWGNKGDAALALSFLPWLKSTFETEEITLTSFTPELDAPHYGHPVLEMIVRPRTPLHKYSSAIARRVPGAGFILTPLRMIYVSLILMYLSVWAKQYLRNPLRARRFVPRHVWGVAEAISSSDLVVSIPGGYLNALRYTDDLWLFHVPTFMLASYLGKPAVLGPCSVGPFTRSHRGFAIRTLDACQLILTREDESVALMRELGVADEKIVRTPDMAFAFPLTPTTEVGLESIAGVLNFARGREIIGVSVREHSFPGHANPKEMQRQYLGYVADSVSQVAESGEAVVVIVPQTLEDIPVGAEFLKVLAARHPSVEALAVSADLTPSELTDLYAKFRLLVGTRMHANILSMSAGTPVAAIAYEPKTMGILSRMGLPEWCVYIDQLDNGRLDALVERQWNDAARLGVTAKERYLAQRELMQSVAGELLARSGLQGSTT